MPIAHFNIARLRALPGEPEVAEFIDAVTQVNRIAERSPGFIWRLADDSTRVERGGDFQAVGGDPLLAISLSIWQDAAALDGFVHRTLHGAFLKRRALWFLPWEGPNYVIWPCAADDRPDIAAGMAMLARRAAEGDSAAAHGFGWTGES